MRFITVIPAFFLAVSMSMAGTLSMKWTTGKQPVSYLPDEVMVFKIQLLEDDKPLSGKILKWTRTGDDRQTSEGETVSSDTQPLEIKTSMGQPGFVHIAVSVLNDDRSPVMDEKKQPLSFHGGAGVEPTKLTGWPEPKDFDAFWKKQKDRLAAVPIKAVLEEKTSVNPKFQSFDVKIDCAGGNPVSGCLTIPKDAAPKSLPATVRFLGYGVAGAHPVFIDNEIAFEINAHGIENGREPQYYEALKAGELKNYAFDTGSNTDPETAYFNGMIFRVMRAVEYIKLRPEWDGKSLAAFGGSQGGFQAVAAAALDSDITSCHADIPWCCDLGGIKLHRLSGWRPEYTDALCYYDPVNMAKRIHCKFFTSTRLGDYVCPPSGVSVLYNNVTAPKTIEYVQGSTHGYVPPNPEKQVLTEK